jgi:hypothetical protein
MKSSNDRYEVRVLINGKPVQEFTHDCKSFIEGRIGTEYTLQIRNHTSRRVLAATSVDGIDVLTGTPANDDSSGYIIRGHSSMEIKGFRKDLDSVGMFKFCKKSQSYSIEAGLDNNNGVIGVRIFEEKEKPMIFGNNEYYKGISTTPYWTCNLSTSTNDSFTRQVKSNVTPTISVNCCTTDSPGVSIREVDHSFSVGTTWGQEKESKVVYADFETGSKVADLAIYYSSIKGLKKLGVPLIVKEQIVFPKAFGNFAKPPKNWNGDKCSKSL